MAMAMGDEQRARRGGEDDQANVPSIDEWDQDFLNEAIEAMEAIEAISSRNTSTSRPPPTPPPLPSNTAVSRTSTDWHTFPSFPSNLSSASISGRDAAFNFSPPRELSQRIQEKPQSLNHVVEVMEIKEPYQGSRRGSYSMRGSGGRGTIGGARTDMEVERLKRELGRVSKQLNHLEHECVELKKETVEKDEQLKCAFSQIEAKDIEIQSLKTEKLEASKQGPLLQNSGACTDQPGYCPKSENNCFPSPSFLLERTTKASNGKSQRENDPSGKHALDYKCHGPKRKNVQTDGICVVSELKRRIMNDNSSTTCSGVSAIEIPAQLKYCKAVGIQTDLVQDTSLGVVKDVSLEHTIGSKLLAIWGSPLSVSPYYKRGGRDMVSKLFVTCSVDFSILFRCMSIVSEKDSSSDTDKESFSGLHGGIQSAQSNVATKVSRLYAILMKMNNEIAELHPLIEALLDLCTSDNISVVHRSLRVLHATLRHLLSCNIISHRRKNVLADQPLNGIYENNESDGLQNLLKDEIGIPNITSLSAGDLFTLFESMQQMTVRYLEEYIRIEALSVMNLILMRCNPYLEREKFDLMTLLETLSSLLRKEVGLHVRKEAVRLLFLLLNCPKMLMMLCSVGKDGTEHMKTADASELGKEINCILNGLLECLASPEAGAQELKLRRQVIILLAYIAAYGKPGFEVLLNTVTPQGVNFLESIIQVLASEAEAEIADPAECKERLSLMREALILLNRLASHPAYSKATLGALMSGNGTGRLTFDVTNRISHANRGPESDGGNKKTKMGAEVVDLARLFRTRVCAFLGENVA